MRIRHAFRSLPFVFLVVTGLFGSSAFGDAPPAPGPGGPEPNPLAIVANLLGLEAPQVQAWADLLHVREAAVRPLVEQVGANDEALRQILEGSTPDPGAVGAIVVAIHSLQAQIGSIADETRTQMEQILTPEQHQRLDQIRHAAQVCPAVPPLRALGLL